MDYFERNLLPLILAIKPSKKKKSNIRTVLGLPSDPTQSVLIKVGTGLEKFWNTAASDSPIVKNLIEESDLIIVDGRERQMDYFFKVLCETWYLEGKCSLELDSEKMRASNQKIEDIALTIGGDVKYGYFLPASPEPTKKEKKKCEKMGMEVYGVNWMVDKIKPPFTSEDYFEFLLDVVGPIVVEKCL